MASDNRQAERLQGARVLIVEDEFFLADDLARALRDAGGQPVGPVGTIRDAEDILSHERVDAAVVDLNLRGSMAFEFVERLAATDLPCVIVSGYGESELPEAVRNIRRLEKPVSAASVMQCVSGELARVS